MTRPSRRCSSARTGTSWSGSASRPRTPGPSACERWPPGGAVSLVRTSYLQENQVVSQVSVYRSLCMSSAYEFFV